jgi:phenylacetate-CoA ligase
LPVADILESRLRRTAGGAKGARAARWESTALVALIARQERQVPYWPVEKIRALQHQRLRQVVAHAFETVPFYRALQQDGFDPDSLRTVADLSSLPMIDGSDLAHDPMPFVCDAYRSQGREVFKTSGSTSGLRKPIFWDHASLLLRAARGERDRRVIARLSGERWSAMIAREFLTTELRHFMARMAGIDTGSHQRLLILPADFSSRTQRTIYSEKSLIPRRPVHYHHLPPTVPFKVAVAHVRAIRPRVVLSFGSYVDQFLHYVHASGESLPMPRLWVYLGDRISPGARALAEELGCRLYSVYGAMEAGTIGFQCEERTGFHLNTDLCAIRLVGERGEDLPPGESGAVVISPLDNRAMVLLNYRLGDRATLSKEPCPCGRTLPLLTQMEGRQSEMIRLGDGREVTSITIEAMFSALLRRTLQAQLAQDAPGSLCWRVVPVAGQDREALEKAMKERGLSVFGSDTRLEVHFVDRIPLTGAGKFLRAVVKSGDRKETADDS